MASMVEDRIEIGESDKGKVFIFHFAEKEDYRDAFENDSFEVRVGNHTILTTSNRLAAETVANALCGVEPEVTAPPAPSPAMEKVIEETRKKVSKA